MSGPSATPPRAELWLGVALLLLPRLARMASGSVHFEDDNYLYSAFLISKGQTPYHDFVQANLPLLEQLTAPFFWLLGPTYRVGELLSAAAWTTSSALLWRLGDRLYGRPAGVWAAILFAWMPLGFRYHLYERETFSLTASLGAAAFLLGEGRTSFVRGLAAGALGGIAFHCKQGGVFPATALFVFLLGSGQRRAAAGLLAGAVGLGGGLFALDWLMYGIDVPLQSFLLHFIKGAHVPLYVRAGRLLEEVAPWLPLAGVGLLSWRGSRWTLFLVVWAALELGFIVQWSATFWPHYMIPLLAPICLLCGAAWASGRPARRTAGMALLAGCLLFAAQAWRTPELRLGWIGGSRLELAQAAATVATWTSAEGSSLLCPPIVALQADRIKQYNYIDTLGFTRQLQTAYREGHLRQTLEQGGRESFSQTLGRANSTWLPEAIERVRAGQIPIVIPEPELPIRPDFLVSVGYRPIFRSQEFWIYASPEAMARSKLSEAPR